MNKTDPISPNPSYHQRGPSHANSEARFINGRDAQDDSNSADDIMTELAKKLFEKFVNIIPPGFASDSRNNRSHVVEPNGGVPNEKEVFSIRETAHILNASEKTIRRYIQRGILKSSRAMRHHRIPRSEIDRFVKATI